MFDHSLVLFGPAIKGHFYLCAEMNNDERAENDGERQTGRDADRHKMREIRLVKET